MRRTVTSWERPSTGILNNFTCKEGTHLVNIILIFFKKQFSFIGVCARYSVMNSRFLRCLLEFKDFHMVKQCKIYSVGSTECDIKLCVLF